MNHTRNNRDVLSWVLGALVVFFGLFFVFHIFSFTPVSHRLFSKRVQKAVMNEDRILQKSKTDLINAVNSFGETYDFLSLDPVLPPNVGAYIFKKDTLVYWNNNLIEPRVLRKRVGESCDTIVNVNSGDFIITSSPCGPYSFYLFSLINTTYPVENKYFSNRFLPALGQHKIKFGDSLAQESFPVYSQSNKLLSYFTIEFPAFGHSTNLSLLVLCGILMSLSLYLFVVRRVLLKRSPKKTPTKQPFIFTVLAFVLVLVVVYFVFSSLFRYGFSQNFFIPEGMRIDYCFFALFFCCLALVTLALWLRRLIGAWIQRRNETLLMIGQLVFWGLLLTLIYNREYTRYENRQIQELAQELSLERDTIFEQSYQHFLDETQTDTIFNSMIFSDDVMEEVAQDYMHNFLFDSVINKYNVSLTLCVPDQELIIQPFNFVTDCESYFQEKIKDNRGVNLGDGLWLMDDNTLDPGYLSTLTLRAFDTLVGTVFLEFSKPIAPQGFGLPKILQDDHNTMLLKSSVASYRDSLLVYKFGSYVFPNFLSDYKRPFNEFSYGRKMKHYVYRVDDNRVLAITLERRDWMEMTSPFVVFFGLLLVLYLLIYFVGRNSHRPSLFRALSSRFQMLVLIALGISFLVFGPLSVIYLRSFYAQKTNEAHYERIRTLSLNITSEVDFSFLKQPGFKTTLDEILHRYSETFFTDINVYGVNGKLLSTTTPELLDMHLQSSLMNADAFHNMQGEKLLYYTQEEHLGNAVYQSSYLAIQDYWGNTLAYLNTPFFSSQSDLGSEILNYVLTYINFILLISLVFFTIVLFLTRKITDPLVRLQEKMRQIDITKPNEQLEWKSKDEIGALINQYNLLVVELEKSAAELRRTAAESAWRGVARQVAHEIKNSLTPMRLSVQLLQRSAEQHGELDERLQRTTSTLLDQIDALSDIASSFSQYAKLPVNNSQPFDLSELVGNLVNLYNNIDNIDFQYLVDSGVDYTFHGDKTNLHSAIGNIIKNATQAIGLKPNGRIEVSLKSRDTTFVIVVNDNGKGIKEEDKKMIFLPNFTTKTGGSGVGLSLAYNIIHSLGGTITFESQEGVGTEFVITLPRVV